MKLALAAVKVDPKSQFPAGGDEAYPVVRNGNPLGSVPRRRKSDRPVSFPCAGVKPII